MSLSTPAPLPRPEQGAEAPVLSRAPEVVVVLDERDAIAFASPAIEDLLGSSSEQLVGRNFLAVVHEADRAAVRMLVDEIRAKSLAITYTIRLIRRDETSVPAEVVVTSLAEDRGLGAVMINLRRLQRPRRPASPPRRRVHQAQTVLDSLQEGVVVLLGDGTVLSCNAAAPELLGATRGRLIGAGFAALLRELVGDGVLYDQFGGALARSRGDEGAHHLAAALDEVVHGWKRPNGSIRWLRYRTRSFGERLAGEQLGSVVVSLTDVSAIVEADRERRGALQELAIEQEFLHALLANLEAGIIACDATGGITLTNSTFRGYGGYLDAQLDPGEPPPVQGLYWADGTPVAAREHPLLQVLTTARTMDASLVMVSPQGHRRAVVANASPLVAPDGRLIGAVANFHDVTAMKQTESELTDLALHDPLTGCANRLLLADRAALAVDLGRREGHAVGLLLVDLDDFKAMNDTYGHLVGDEVLVEVARRLMSTVRPGDTVARYGGDEFVVLCQITGGDAELATVKARVVEQLSQAYQLSTGEVKVSASIGEALLAAHEADLDEVLRIADASMYQEKQLRRR